MRAKHRRAWPCYKFDCFLYFAYECTDKINATMPSGTHVETVNDVPYVPSPKGVGICETAQTCKDVCVIKTCNETNSHQLVHKIGPNQFRTYSTFMQLRIQDVNTTTCFCPTLGAQAADIAEVVDGFLNTSFRSGKVYLSYQGAMESADGDLLVLDQPYCNEYVCMYVYVCVYVYVCTYVKKTYTTI